MVWWRLRDPLELLAVLQRRGRRPGLPDRGRSRSRGHLIPVALLALLGKGDKVKIFGTDWATPDGACIRDFIHVCVLAEAHFLALQALRRNTATTAYNLGNGRGFSVKEVIQTVEKVTGRKVTVEPAPRRAGDPARLVASADRIKTELGWRPKHPQLDTIIQHAWNWHNTIPDSYRR